MVAGRVALAALEAGLLELPPPGTGATAARWAVLAELATADVTLAKLAEAHADAVVILGELGGPAPGDALWAVWAAVTPALRAHLVAGRWLLSGSKPWASGASCCRRALVTALAPDGERLFAIDTDGPGVVPRPGSWPAVAMSGTGSVTLDLTDVPATPVGAVGEYVDRTGFWSGGAGIAACWYGGAVGVAAPLRRKVAAGPDDPFRAAHLGAVHAALAATAATLAAAAARFDAQPARARDGSAVTGQPFDGSAVTGQPFDGFAVAMTARVVAEQCAGTVIERVGRALGPGPLAGDRAHARRVADLGLFVRQSHAEADLADLGRHVAY